MKFELAAADRKKKSFPSTETGRIRAQKKESAHFVILLTRGNLALLWEKRVIIARSEIILRTFAEKDCGILAGKRYTQSLNRRAVTTKPIF